MVEAIRAVMGKHGLRAITYGHIGDGNLHVNILRMDLPEEQFRRRLGPAVRELFERTLALGGQITGEHGIGYVQRGCLPLAFPPHSIALLQSLKRVFDPKGILNPGKIFPEGPSGAA